MSGMNLVAGATAPQGRTEITGLFTDVIGVHPVRLLAWPPLPQDNSIRVDVEDGTGNIVAIIDAMGQYGADLLIRGAGRTEHHEVFRNALISYVRTLDEWDV
jgi:hypothetical protein